MSLLLFLLPSVICYNLALGHTLVSRYDHWDDDLIEDFDEAWEAFYDIDGFDESDIKNPDVKKARMQAFQEFSKQVHDINADYDIPFDCENNFFSILTPEERNSYLGLKNISFDDASFRKRESSLPQMEFTDKGDVTVTSQELSSKTLPAVKDQQQCGSCWAFGGAASLEAEIFMTSGMRIPLSEQEFTDCALTSDGCQGGWMSNCFKYVHKTGRIAPESDVRYSAKYRAGQNRESFCNSYRTKANALKGDDYLLEITQDVYVTGLYENAMKLEDFNKVALKAASSHVLSVAIHASSKLMSYKSGVLVDLEASGKDVNHAVNIVGFGRSAKKGLNYWLIRNSWGEKWGRRGYFYLDREQKNHIGIQTIVHFPKIKCTGSGCKKPGQTTTDPEDPGENKKECTAASGNYPCPSKGNQCYHCHQCPETKHKCKDGDNNEEKDKDNKDGDNNEEKDKDNSDWDGSGDDDWDGSGDDDWDGSGDDDGDGSGDDDWDGSGDDDGDGSGDDDGDGSGDDNWDGSGDDDSHPSKGPSSMYVML